MMMIMMEPTEEKIHNILPKEYGCLCLWTITCDVSWRGQPKKCEAKHTITPVMPLNVMNRYCIIIIIIVLHA